MFKNYFKTAFRSLSANKIYSIVTTAGLAVGVAVCLIIFIFIRYEQSFDNFHHNKARIYRIMTRNTNPGDKGDPDAAVPFPLPTAMKNDFPDWTSAGIFGIYNMQIEIKNKAGQTEKKFKERDGVFVLEPSFFSILDFPALAGDPSKALKDPDAVVLTRATAERYFGDWKQAIGQSITVENQRPATVRAILADPPSNTDFQFKVALPYSHASFSRSKDWWSINGAHECYVLLPPGVSVNAANRQLNIFSKKYRTPDNHNTQTLESLGEAHFDAKAVSYSGKTISPERIRTLWLIAGFILLIACVNFVNLATAQAVNRAREVGVRKVLGSNRQQLTLQFLLEALVLVITGVASAVLLTALLLVPVSNTLDIPLSFEVFRQPSVLSFLTGTTLAVTILAGFYPALVLSYFNPINALKSKLAAKSNRGITLRRGLVVLQFVIAQALIIGTLLILRQINYFGNTSMGFSKDAIVTVPFPGDSAGISKLSYLHNRLSATKGIEDISFNNTAPADDDNWWTGFNFDHATKGIKFAAINKYVDANYLNTYSLPLVAGRNITTTDSIREFLVNETLAKKLGFSNPNEVLNKEINLWNGFAVGPIVGVIKDFHSSSLKDSIAPVFMLNHKKGFNAAGIKIGGANLAATMQAIEKIWNETYPDYVFEYQFLDEKIASFYKEEAQLSKFYKIFASIAIFLSCLGLYGLASFMAVQRIKEVGIRKVLGATAGSIVYLFSKEFIGLIGLAFIIAAPIAWYFVHLWLQQYVYRLPISAWIFVTGGVLAVLIALATVGFQAFKAAMVNPVKNLRTE
jgi:putative ABC transport system permease protein